MKYLLVITLLFFSLLSFGQGSFSEFKELYNKSLKEFKVAYNKAFEEFVEAEKKFDEIIMQSDYTKPKTKATKTINKNTVVNNSDLCPSIAPISGTLRITSPFGYRIHPIFKRKYFHGGIDIACPTGTKVLATADGKIVKTGFNKGGYGYYIIIKTGDKYKTVYGHLSKILVKEYQNVKKGEVIGLSGNTGRSTGPHLHYEVIKNNKKVNSKLFINKK